MKINIIKITILISLIVFGGRQGHSQGTFVNLDFESATPPFIPDIFGKVPISSALPGWIAYIGGTPRDRVLYNNTGLDAPSVSLFDAQNPFSLQPIDGNYSVYLKFSAVLNQPVINAGIGQTGQVPNDAASLRFALGPSGGVLVSFGGQNIPLVLSDTVGNIRIMAGDISSFAGQTAELLILGNAALLDDIQFSSIPIPEPSTVGLFGLGTLLLGWRRFAKLR